MNVTMISPESLKEFTVEWLGIITTEGSRTILPGHAPLIAQLLPERTLSMKLPGGAIKTISVVGGVIHVERDRVVIILEA